MNKKRVLIAYECVILALFVFIVFVLQVREYGLYMSMMVIQFPTAVAIQDFLWSSLPKSASIEVFAVVLHVVCQIVNSFILLMLLKMIEMLKAEGRL